MDASANASMFELDASLSTSIGDPDNGHDLASPVPSDSREVSSIRTPIRTLGPGTCALQVYDVVSGIAVCNLAALELQSGACDLEMVALFVEC